MSRKRRLRRLKPNLVHCVTPKGILYGGIAARFAGVPGIVIAVSGMGFAFTRAPQRSLRRALIALVYRFLARLPYAHRNKRVIVQNQDDRRAIVESGLATSDEVVLIPGSGVDLDRFRHVDMSMKKPLVLFPARMLVEKGVLDFIEAARLLKAEVPGWRFVMAGTADYLSPSTVSEQLLRDAEREGVIEWLGHVDEMASLYQQASIVCLPSYYREGIPKALLEAAACGCAVVTTDATGCREAIIPGMTGDLVEPHNSRHLATVLNALITDQERRCRYGEAGRKLAEEKFGIKHVINRTMDIYGALMESQPLRDETSAEHDAKTVDA